MKNTILLTEKELVNLIRKTIVSEEFDDYGTPGKFCWSYRRKKDGTLISDRMMDCGLLNPDGTIKDEVSKKIYDVSNTFASVLLPKFWEGRFLYPNSYGKKKPVDETIEKLINLFSTKEKFQKVKDSFNAGINNYKFNPVVTKRPTFGEALATYLVVDFFKDDYESLKNHLNKLGIKISLGKGPSGLTEIKFYDSKSGGSGLTRFTPCSGTYNKGCSSTKIAEVQKCLGLSGRDIDGKWGDKTQQIIKQQFPEFAKSFTDKDVAVICGKK